MTRLDKCKLLESKGYTYNKDTGKIYGIYGKEIKNLSNYGYLRCTSFGFALFAHHFAWYMTYGNVDFEELDHINRIKTDNRIVNLRKCTKQENLKNKNFIGITYNKTRKKWQLYSKTEIVGKYKFIGLFNSKKEALNAKKQYNV